MLLLSKKLETNARQVCDAGVNRLVLAENVIGKTEKSTHLVQRKSSDFEKLSRKELHFLRPAATGVAIMIVVLLKFEVLTCCVAFCGEIIWIHVRCTAFATLSGQRIIHPTCIQMCFSWALVCVSPNFASQIC